MFVGPKLLHGFEKQGRLYYNGYGCGIGAAGVLLYDLALATCLQRGTRDYTFHRVSNGDPETR